MFEDRGPREEGVSIGKCHRLDRRVVTNMLVRDMDLGVPVAGDNRRLEVVAGGLPLHGNVDTTLMSNAR